MREQHLGSDDLVTRQGAAGRADPTDLFVGPASAPDRYELLGPPLSGGEGATWRARYLGELDKPVQMAVKVLDPPPAGADWPTAELLAGWRDRLELLRSAHPPHVVRLFDVEEGLAPHRLGARDTAPTVLVEMEWVEGGALLEAIGSRPATRATLAERLGWVADLAEAISGLHGLDNAAVHRDVSPGNCIVTAQRGLVLIDLSTVQLPVDGVDLLGRHTPAYSAPEVLAAPYARRAAAADRWAVGAIAYYCLTGAHPPRSSVQRAAGIGAAVKALGAPTSAAATVLAMLDDDPDSRPADLVAWVARLRDLLRRRRRRARVVALPLVACIGVACAVAAFTVPSLISPAVHTESQAGVRAIAPDAASSGLPSESTSISASTQPSSAASAATSSASPSSTDASRAPTSASAVPTEASTPTAAAAVVPTQDGCLATATTHSFALPDGGSVDSSVAYGPLALSRQCDFIAIKLTEATYVTWARACLDTAAGPGMGRCGAWVRLSYPNTWDTLLTGVSGGDVSWTLDIYGEASEPVQFSHTN